jgi:hypothetical protein
MRVLSMEITNWQESRMRRSTAAGSAKHPLRNNMAVATKDDFREFGLAITVGSCLMCFC